MARRKKDDALDFEQAIKKLEEIVRRLEEEQVPLEESLRLFAEGKKLARACEQGLTEAENRVKLIIEDAEGNLKEAPLDADDTDEPEDISISEPLSGGSPPEFAPPSKKRDDLPF